ncbi:MAG: ribosome-associated translation inhibitor RaiA [Rhodospirillales bacterium]|jgi:ribosomal subunit interface protein|nr:ribosome-associated translation inhibitor RaiA [Rhodospirillales bacterium]
MEITVKGKNLNVGDSLRTHVEENLDSDVKKYFDRALHATVLFSREAHLFRADVTVHAGRGMTMQGKCSADEIHAAFDGALDRITKQLRRYKRRLRDHHKARGAEETLSAQQYVIAPGAEDEEVSTDAQPTIVAEMEAEIDTITVSEAVMHMDLADSPVVMFRNRAHGGLNVVYRRPDGNIGWIDPRGMREG